ncbi:hypothetical protein [Streptomyces sp. NPDC094468]|uniref:hypothetical protein n=1 Tax=Streptomyces sp. NPDC094468 TaxID=3366066 RepID=UPI00380EF4DC
MTVSTLPAHPLTGATALGWRKARPGENPDEQYPIWPVLGAADDDDDDQDDGGDGGDDADDDQDDDSGDGGGDQGYDGDGDQDGADQLGDAGKQALDRMKERWRKERERRKAVESERDQLKGAGGNADDPERIRTEAAAAATAKANQRIVRSEIRAAAAGKLTNPRDALHFLDLGQFEVDEDGQVDEDEVADAIENLLKERPYLGAAAAKAPEPRFQGSGDGGARKGSSGPKQLGEQDLKKMTPEQIDEAHRKGQLRDYLGG